MNNGGPPIAALRRFTLAWIVGATLTALAAVFALTERLPIRDPDDVWAGYLWMPTVLLAAILLDVAPRVMHRAARQHSLGLPTLRRLSHDVVRERWPASQWWFALSGVTAWYLCYSAFRNVKSMAPFVHDDRYDEQLAAADRWLFAGHDPATVLHEVLGTGIAAHLLSAVYLLWIGLVPLSIACALVWTRRTAAGAWYVTAVAVDWLLGALTYLLLPTLGPVYTDAGAFDGLPRTYVGGLQEDMLADRQAVLADPWSTTALQSIAAFASLHVAIMVTLCLVAELVRLPRAVRIAAWVFLALTCLSTIYLGWHFAVDVIAGAVLGAVAVWAGGLATGNRDGWRVRLIESDRAAASDGRHEAPE